jgi:mRNA interferase MazF
MRSDLFAEHPSVTILPMTSQLRDAPLFRVAVAPRPQSGLQRPSQIMIDKARSVPREKPGPAIGRLDDRAMLAVNQALAVFLRFS